MVEQASTSATGGAGKGIVDMRVVHSSLNRVATQTSSTCYAEIALLHAIATCCSRPSLSGMKFRGGLGKQ
jgi:hypothetical protein